jgi:hypothetical protein
LLLRLGSPSSRLALRLVDVLVRHLHVLLLVLLLALILVVRVVVRHLLKLLLQPRWGDAGRRWAGRTNVE